MSLEPTITLDLLKSLNPEARVEHSCHRLYDLSGELHYGVKKDDENEFITEDTCSGRGGKRDEQVQV